MGKAIVGAGKRTEAGGKRGVKPGGGRTPGLVSKVRRTILRRSLAVPGDLILVACSGGADSTALLHVLRDLGAEFSFRLAVAHFDHGLRASSGR
ncbi:MAG TPA: ATP-binding protein, partial [Candidatus Aminicenantes bacterium]|nr:ATP-binding protein [Candidatus Aminicenantes bacterium]